MNGGPKYELKWHSLKQRIKVTGWMFGLITPNGIVCSDGVAITATVEI